MHFEGTGIKIKEVKTKSFLIQANRYTTILLAAVLLYAGINKITSPSALIENLTSLFKFLPENLIIIIASILPLIEIGIGTALIFSVYEERIKKYKKAISLSAAILLGLFLAYSVYGYAAGMNNDCGCCGDALKSDFGLSMIIRNLILFLMTSLNIVFNTNRPRFKRVLL